MRREKEVPVDLLEWLDSKKKQEQEQMRNSFETTSLYCTIPVRAVKMKMLKDDFEETFRTAIIPAVDIYLTKKAFLKKGFFKRDSLYFFVGGTQTPFPYGHVYASSGTICLGSIFVPSAVPEKSPATPLETLFLHNDRNLSHGDSHLCINKGQANAIKGIMDDAHIELSKLGSEVIWNVNADILANDQIWCLSADVVKQKSLPAALRIMTDVYNAIFDKKEESRE